jgi:hypothetical protein
MDKRLWLIEADQMTEFGDIVSYSVRMYADDAGAAWLTFARSFRKDTMWNAISVREVKRNE